LFCDAKAAEGLSPRTVRWYGDILRRAVARFGAHTVLEAIDAPTLRAWLVELRATLASRTRGCTVRSVIGRNVSPDGSIAAPVGATVAAETSTFSEGSKFRRYAAIVTALASTATPSPGANG
jgi:hypothetical protein